MDRMETDWETLADLKQSGFVHHGSMLAGGGVNSSGAVHLQSSPEGPLAPVKFEPPTGTDYKVKVEVFVESQSPRCKLYTEWVLGEVVRSQGMLDIMNLSIVPWGKTRLLQKDGKPTVVVGQGEATKFEGPEPQFLCEHGPSECEGNAWMACIQQLYPDVHQWFRVLSCMLTRTCAEGETPAHDSVAHTGAGPSRACGGMPKDVAPRCIEEVGYGMDAGKVEQCVHSPRGLKLLLENMDRTEAVHPKPWHLPWVVVDGMPVNHSQSMLLGKTVCDTYASKVRPFVPLINGTARVPQPLGCFFFPDEPPIFPQLKTNSLFITILWVGGGLVFVAGISILAYWKYSTIQSQREYEEVGLA
uniref:Uncharacterized protein n=2 Tax=Hemiselmis andersenii TaxID=464988 RepID=A0A7S0TV25_HEMAN|mmetsp:Transcript_26782/g.62101  ORF Transcript_26782/g.62101 Transcript_26782/m.62101 type:complete len:358 (+) Transcript_26782:2-1075(+)